MKSKIMDVIEGAETLRSVRLSNLAFSRWHRNLQRVGCSRPNQRDNGSPCPAFLSVLSIGIAKFHE